MNIIEYFYDETTDVIIPPPQFQLCITVCTNDCVLYENVEHILNKTTEITSDKFTICQTGCV